MLTDTKDPTKALFMSAAGARRAARGVCQMYPETVKKCVVKPSYRQGELQGYVVVAHKSDRSLSAPITNSDFERIEQALGQL